MTYNTSKNKLSKIWNRSKKNQDDLNKKDLEDKDLYKKLQTFKYPITLIESDDIYVVPQSVPSIRSTKKNTKLPSTLAYNAFIDITIPEEFLPFLELEVDWFPLPSEEIVSVYAYEQSDYTGNEVEVKGDSTLIYTGAKSKTDRKFLHQQTEIDNGNILEENTKKIFNATIIYQDTLGDTYKITGLLYQLVFKTDIGTGCSGNETFTDYNVQIDPDTVDFLYFSEFNTMSSSSVNITSQKRVVDWTDPGSGCMQSVTTTDNVTQTFSLSSVQEFYQLQSAQKFKLISGEYVLQPLATEFIADERDPVNDTILSREFTEVGFWLHYSSDRRALFGIANDNFDGEDDDLIGLPDSSDITGLALPYSSITLKQNTESLVPQRISSIVIQGTQGLPFIYKKISKSTEKIPTYRINPLIRGVLVSRASKDNPNSQSFDTYDDIYTVSGTTYTKTTEDHGTVVRTTYVPENQDIKMNYRIRFNNPLFFDEQKRFKNYGI